MQFRFTYSAAGVANFVASPPAGWDVATIGFDRSPQYSLVEFFKSNFSAWGNNGSEDGGRNWLLAAEILNGADSIITQLIEIDENDSGIYQYFFQSVLSVATMVEKLGSNSHLLDFTLSQDDFWTKFTNRFDSVVDIESATDLDGNVVPVAPVFTLPLPCQKIHKTFLKQTTGDPTSNFLGFFAGAPITLYLKFDLNDLTLDEIDGRQNYSTQISNIYPVTALKYDWKVTEKGAYTLFSRPLFKITTDVDITGNVKWWITTGRPGAYTNQQIGITYNFAGKGFTSPIEELNPDLNLIINNYLVNLEIGDEIYVYGEFNITITGGGGGVNATYYPGDAAHLTTAPYVATLQIRADTVTPASSCDAVLTHDVAYAITDRIAGTADLFRSNELGNAFTKHVYGATGCGSMIANMLGLHIRGYSVATKPLTLSMKDWWEGINPLLCLGLGYEKVAGVNQIVCEKIDHFFDATQISVNFMNVFDIKRSYDPAWQFKSFQFGNQKWESKAKSGTGSPSGIDDPQSQRNWNSRFQNIGAPLNQLSKWLMASLSIETARRLSIDASSNYEYDNDVCAIEVIDTGGGALAPALDHDFSAVTNLLNSSTRYNLSYTPARALLRWSKFWSGCLQDYLASFVNFVSGVGNFTMTSTKTTVCDGDDTGVVVAENGNFAIGTDYLFLPTPLEINHYLDYTTYKYLRDNKNWSVNVSQTEAGFTQCFIKSLEYNKVKGTVRMVVWPKTKFVIKRPETIESIDGPRVGVRYFDIYFGPEFA